MNITFIDGTCHAKCQLCGAIDQLRPYGPKEEYVCFNCMMKDEFAAKERFHVLVKRSPTVIK